MEVFAGGSPPNMSRMSDREREQHWKEEVKRLEQLTHRLADQLMLQQTETQESQQKVTLYEATLQQKNAAIRELERKAADWERLAKIVETLGEDAMMDILKQKDLLELKVEEMKQRMEDMKFQKRKAEAEPQGLRATIKDIRTKLHERDEEIKTLEEFRKKESDHQSKLSNLKTKLTKTEKVLKESKDKLRNMRDEKAMVDVELDKVKKAKIKADRGIEQAQDSERGLKNIMDEKDGELQSLKLMVNRYKSEVTELERKYNRKCEEYDKDRRKFSSQGDMHHNLEQEVKILKKKNLELQEKVNGHRPWGDLREIILELHPKEAEKQHLTTQLFAQKEALTKKDKEISKYKKEALDMQHKYEMQCSLSDTIQHQLQEEKRHVEMKKKLDKANYVAGTEKQKAEGLEQQLHRQTQLKLQSEVKLQEYRMRAETLEVGNKALHNKLNEVQAERDQQKNVLELTHNEMAVVIVSLKQMEAQVDEWKKNETVRAECEVLRNKCEGLQTQVEHFQKQNQENFTRYQAKLHAQNEQQKAQLASQYAHEADDAGSDVTNSMRSDHESDYSEDRSGNQQGRQVYGGHHSSSRSNGRTNRSGQSRSQPSDIHDILPDARYSRRRGRT